MIAHGRLLPWQMFQEQTARSYYVGPDNPVRFIEAFVDGLDLAAVGFERVAAKETGRPGFDPVDMLKLYIYGYVNRVRSSRRLEAEAHRNIEVTWLLRHLTPDVRTIAAFRRINHSAFRKVFREFVILCRQLDSFGRELLAVDGTRIKAVNNKDRNFTRGALSKFIREADKKLALTGVSTDVQGPTPPTTGKLYLAKSRFSASAGGAFCRSCSPATAERRFRPVARCELAASARPASRKGPELLARSPAARPS